MLLRAECICRCQSCGSVGGYIVSVKRTARAASASERQLKIGCSAPLAVSHPETDRNLEKTTTKVKRHLRVQRPCVTSCIGPRSPRLGSRHACCVPIDLYYYSKVLLDTKPVDIIAKLKFSDNYPNEKERIAKSDYRQKERENRQKRLSPKVRKVPGKTRRTFRIQKGSVEGSKERSVSKK